MSHEDIRDLRSDIRVLTQAVADLTTEIALIKRDRQWAKWFIGVVSSAMTLAINFMINKGA